MSTPDDRCKCQISENKSFCNDIEKQEQKEKKT